MPYAVVIARQRSGTTAFGELLHKGLDLRFHGEILDPRANGPAISASEGTATWPRVEAFLRQLHEDSAFHLIDTKVNSLYAVGQPFRSPVLPPPLFDLFRQHQSKIIRLHRHPAAQWISGLIATQAGVWHQRGTKRVAVGKVRVDPVTLETFLRTSAAEDALLAGWLDGLAPLDLHYEQIFGQDDYSATVEQVSAFVGCALRSGWRSARPGLHKIANPSLANNIENIDEVGHLLPLDAEEGGAAAPLMLSDFDAPMRRRIEGCQAALREFIGGGVLQPRLFADKVVLDWECGDGAFAAAFGLAGARRIIGSDRWLDIGHLPEALRTAPQYRFRRAELVEFEQEIIGAVDLVFANTVTEHLPDLPRDFSAVHRVLKPGGYLMLNHDNYYQPVGSHDHGFLYYDGKGGIAQQGPDCWNLPEKCAASDAHRNDVASRLPWTWDARNEAGKDPLNCEACHYYKRSQPWAHLIWQGEFDRLYPQDSFSTGRPASSLNKVTIFQLRQFLIEAGFEIEREHRASVTNQPPDALLQGRTAFTPPDLQTNMYRVLARRKG